MPGTDLATTSGTLALDPQQTGWTDEQLAVLRHVAAERATAADLRVFLHRCQQLELDPFAGQIYLVDYGGKPTIQVGIHGLESIARTVADRGGFDIEWEDDQWCGPDGQWSDVWLGDDPPHAARAVLIRDGKRYSSVALYRENVGMRKVYEGPKGNRQWTGGWEVNDMWGKRPAHMTSKCARADVLRKAFPRQLADIRVPEEMGERPESLRGEVVREDTPTDEQRTLAHWLDLVDAATTRDELLALWRQAEPLLSIHDRGRLTQACQQAAAALQQAASQDGGVLEPEASQEPRQAASEPAEPVEAEIVEPEPTPVRASPQRAPEPPPREPASSTDVRMIDALIRRWQDNEGRVLERDERRRFLAFHADADPDSIVAATDLTRTQASRAIAELNAAIDAQEHAAVQPDPGQDTLPIDGADQ